jgi:hypothetical protein
LVERREKTAARANGDTLTALLCDNQAFHYQRALEQNLLICAKRLPLNVTLLIRLPF